MIAFQSGFNDKALDLIARALGVAPKFPEALNNMGNVLAKMGRLEDALLSFREAVAQKPDYAIAYNHLGGTLLGLGRLDEAAAGYKAAIAVNPKFAEARFNLGRLYLLMGRYGEGWKEYGWRRQEEEFNHAHRPYMQAVWDGSDPDGKTLFFFRNRGSAIFSSFSAIFPWWRPGAGGLFWKCRPRWRGCLKGSTAPIRWFHPTPHVRISIVMPRCWICP